MSIPGSGLRGTSHQAGRPGGTPAAAGIRRSAAWVNGPECRGRGSNRRRRVTRYPLPSLTSWGALLGIGPRPYWVSLPYFRQMRGDPQVTRAEEWAYPLGVPRPTPGPKEEAHEPHRVRPALEHLEG